MLGNNWPYKMDTILCHVAILLNCVMCHDVRPFKMDDVNFPRLITIVLKYSKLLPHSNTSFFINVDQINFMFITPKCGIYA
jgi:hypothetical protein